MEWTNCYKYCATANREEDEKKKFIWIIKCSCVERALRPLLCNEKKENGFQNDIQEEEK